MELFKTSGILDEAVLKELGKKGIPASMNALIIILFIGGIALIFLEKYLLAAVYLFGFLFFLLVRILLKRITVNKNLRNMRELNGTDRYEYITWFDEEGLVGINLTNHAEVKLLYQSLKRVVETEQVLAVVTRGSQFQPVFKKDLEQRELEDLMAFLQSRNKKLKIIRMKHKK